MSKDKNVLNTPMPAWATVITNIKGDGNTAPLVASIRQWISEYLTSCKSADMATGLFMNNSHWESMNNEIIAKTETVIKHYGRRSSATKISTGHLYNLTTDLQKIIMYRSESYVQPSPEEFKVARNAWYEDIFNKLSHNEDTLKDLNKEINALKVLIEHTFPLYNVSEECNTYTLVTEEPMIELMLIGDSIEAV